MAVGRDFVWTKSVTLAMLEGLSGWEHTSAASTTYLTPVASASHHPPPSSGRPSLHDGIRPATVPIPHASELWLTLLPISHAIGPPTKREKGGGSRER